MDSSSEKCQQFQHAHDLNGISQGSFRLHIFRVQSFLRELLTSLNENPVGWAPIVKESTKYAMHIMSLRKKINATINEIALASFWHVTQSMGINKFNLLRLVKFSRKVLRKRILYRRMLKILSHIRILEEKYSPHNELIRIVITVLPKIATDKKVKTMIERKNLVSHNYIEELKSTALEIINSLNSAALSGKSRKVLAALSLYVADKVIAKRKKNRPIISAKLLEQYIGISQFTILRRYKMFLKEFSIGDLFEK